MKASIHDLAKELWLRQRNTGQIVWKTKDGKEIPINEMSDSHLINAIRKYGEYLEMIDKYYDCIADIEDAGDR